MDSNLPAAVCALGLVRNFVGQAHWAGYGGHSHFPVNSGDSGGIRTPNMRFWRPPFCQLELPSRESS